MQQVSKRGLCDGRPQLTGVLRSGRWEAEATVPAGRVLRAEGRERNK